MSIRHALSFEVRGVFGVAVLALAMAAATAAAVFLFYPASYVTGSHPYWQLPTGDLADHSAAANHFIRGEWGLPLFHVATMGVPEGTNIVYSDPNPLMALVFRVVYQLSGEAWLYFSWWAFLAALLQGPSFVAALYAAGVRNAAVLLLGGAFALFAPIWWHGFGHVNLFGQFPILLALACHFAATRGQRPGLAFAGFALLLALASLVHAYLLVMVAMLLAMTLLSVTWTERLTALKAAVWAAAALAPAILVMALGGHLGSPLIPRNYGLYSLNLLGFVTPQMSGLVPGFEDYLLDATGGQSQGFAYLGAGGLLLLVVALAAARDQLAEGLARDPTRLFAGLAILLLGASYAVHAGPFLVAGIDHAAVRQAFLERMAGEGGLRQALADLGALDWLRIALLVVLAAAPLAWILWLARRRGRRQLLWLLGGGLLVLVLALAIAPRRAIYAVATFQASGRFAWLLVYLVLVLAVSALARRFSPPVATAVLAASVVLQVLDTAPLQERLRAEIMSGEAARYPDREVIEAAFAEADPVVLSPAYLCANIELTDAEARQTQLRILRRLQFLASRAAAAINSATHVRRTTHAGFGELPDCAEERRRALSGEWGEDAIYFFLAGATPEGAIAALRGEPGRCRDLTDGLLCRGPGQAASWNFR